MSSPRPPRLSAGRKHGEQGQALVLVAAAMTVMMLMAALAIEMGRAVSERRFLQNAVDAAALAGAFEFKQSRARGEDESIAAANARSRALATLQTHFANEPTGSPPSNPADPPVFDASCGTTPRCLIDGILVSPATEPGAIRVAMRNEVDSTFARLTALVPGADPIESFTVGARAYAGPDPAAAGPLPIAVREFIDGQPGGTSPCPAYVGGPAEYFRAVFATADTSCVGTKDSSAGRTVASTSVPGPKVPILASGADANNGISFRGFVALDIRDFSTPFSQKYYNGVTPSTNPQTLKQMQADYICSGYPGPDFPPITSPPDPGLQVAALDGNSAGIAVDSLTDCYTADDLIAVLVYSGEVRSIPEFTMAWGGGSKPYEIQVPETGTYANNRSFRVSRNQAFVGEVSLDTIWDPNDPDHPYNNGTLSSVPPISYSPNPVVPALNGTTVQIQNVSTTGATRGIYSLIIRGTAVNYSNQFRYLPATINVGNVARDFSINGPTPNGCDIALNVGDTINCTFSISNIGGGGSAFGGTVTLTVERLDGTIVQTLGTGIGVGQNRQTSIPTSGLSQGIYWYVIRATGLNQDGVKVTRLLPFSINVAPSSSPGDDEYVDIKGYAIMKIVCAPGPQCMPPNRVDAEALTGILDSLDDPAFEILKEVRLLPWTYSP